MNTSQATRAALFLNGSNRQAMLLQRSSTSQLWGSVRTRASQLSLNRAKAVSLRCSAQPNKPKAAVSAGSFVSADELPSLVEKPAAEVIHFYR
ncbi:PREDICTED: probable phosphoribosylformylglycinamidine synthase, chloroplastic/mitochondrial, partial [Camelina sativa]